MSRKVPNVIAIEIRERVFEECDRYRLFSRSRSENKQFTDQLVKSDDVGGRLSQYMQNAEIRTYIKDAILNRYSKEKKEKERPDRFEAIIKDRLDVEAECIEQDSKLQISLYRSPNSPTYVVVADGTYLKWETALRKALTFIASKPFSARENTTIHIMLTLFARHQKIPPSDITCLKKALKPCGAFAFIYGDR